MPEPELKRAGGLAYRELAPSEPSEHPPVLCVHGFPQSSYMWRDLMAALADSGRRALAPDLAGFGDSPPDPPGTWERQVEALERWREAIGLGPAVLVVHDWGGLIALRWACDRPGTAAGLVLSNTGFFPDGEWHGMAKALRTEGQGEVLIDSLSRDGLAAMLAGVGSGFDEGAADEYFKAFATEEGRRGVLELYRSGDFSQLEPYRGKLAELGVPALALWGERDDYAPPAGAFRFAKELPDTRVVLVEDAGHFVFEDAADRCAAEVLRFLDGAGL